MAASSSRDVWVVEDAGAQRLMGRYIAAALDRRGLAVRCMDLNGGADALLAEAVRCPPRLSIFSLLFAEHLDECLALAVRLRAAGVSAHLTLAGPLPALAYADLLDACPALDSVIAGDPEPVAAALALALDGPAQWTALPGLACRRPDPLLNPPAPPPSLDDLAPPRRDDPLPCFRGLGFATLKASRGCYHACTFCLPRAFYLQQAVPYRARSVGNLVDEIEMLYERGARLFLFDDEEFLPPPSRRHAYVHALAQELERRRLSIGFTIKCRADDVELALFDELGQMGLLRVYVGIESGCAATLERLGKGVTVQQNADALLALNQLGIVADFGTLVFHPWSTVETLRADIAFLRALVPYVPTLFQFWEIEVYPGTPIAAQLRGEGCGTSNAGRIEYTITDPHVERLRQLARTVFGPGSGFAAFHKALTEDWFDHLLARRFYPSPEDAARSAELKQSAARVNAAALDLWEEMMGKDER